MWQRLKCPNSKIVGIDPDDLVVKIAKKKVAKLGLNIEIIKAYGEKLPFEDSSFDIVTNILVLHHLPTEIKKQLMQEVWRVLKPRRRFLVVDFGKPENTFWKILMVLQGIFEEAKYLKDNIDGKISSFLQEAGFNVKEVCPSRRGVQFLLATKK